MPDRPIVNIETTALKPGGNAGSFAYQSARLGPGLGLRKLGASLYVVPPGKRAFPFHAHSEIEEVFFILEGSGTLRHDDEEFPIKAGDMVAAPTGSAHQIINTSENDLRYLAFSTNDSTDVVLYPDSGKVLAYAPNLGEGLVHITGLDSAMDYYDGED